MLKSFKDLIVWQKAHQIVISVYRLSLPKSERFGLESQIRRAAVSIAANIVEGFKKKTIRESLRFYNISQASLEETKYHLLLAKDLKYIPISDYKSLYEKMDELGKILHGWIKSHKY